MRLSIWSLCASWLAFASVSGAEPETFEHDLWNSVVQRFVSDDGSVDYSALKKDPDELFRYVEAVGRTSPDNSPGLFPTPAHRLAYWINAYNALILARVVRGYPVDSIKDLGGFGGSVFGKKQVVGGKRLSHDDIEHKIIRKRFDEPRIHFVLNCASRSCAPLRNHALTAENLEQSLQEAAVNFLNDERNVRIHPDRGTIEVSKYFDWFKKDFLNGLREEKAVRKPSVVDYLRIYLNPDKLELLSRRPRWKIRFIDYDWKLNDAGDSSGGSRSAR